MSDTKPMTNLYVNASHLPQMEEIARVSGWAEGKRVWTELAVYYRSGFIRQFVAVVEGKTTGEQGFVPKFKATASGTLDRALAWFEDSALTQKLYEMIPEGIEAQWPTANQVSAAIDAGRDFIADRKPKLVADAPLPRVRVVGYPGAAKLVDALAWLYPEIAAPSKLVERDFGMPSRTVRHAMSIEAGETAGNQGAWVQLFIASLRYFDRELWQACRDKALGQ